MINLQELLNNENNKKNYRYLLLDMLGTTSELSPLYINALRDNLSLNDIAIIKRPELLHDVESCPHLVCLGRPNHDINDSLLEASIWQIEEDHLVTKQYVCAWIVTELEINELANCLLQIGESLGTFCNMKFNPFYEPFRLQLLQDMFIRDPQWIGQFFPVNLTYYYVSTNQKYRQIIGKEVNTIPYIHQEIITTQQEIAILFRLYVTWYEINTKQEYDIKDDALFNIAKYYIISKSMGLINNEDKFVFVLLSMKYGDLSKSKTIQDAIEHSVAGQLANKLSEIDLDHSLLDELTITE